MLLATSAGGSNGSYTVRAIFDDAGNMIPGENVKIGGVNGRHGRLGHADAAGTRRRSCCNIDNPGFQDFRADASCTIRPQALIGEKFVDCLPTQPRVEGTPLPPPLHKIPSGHEGAGEYLLPVQNTHSPVDVDLLGDINRLPERQRLTIILNELGAGLAGRGSDLSAVIRRANPALQELDKVLAILASENHVLAKLAVDSDKALQPLARVRKQFADFIAQSNDRRAGERQPPAARSKQTSNFPAVPEAARARRWNGSQRFAEADDADVHRPRDRGARRSTRPSRSLPAFSQQLDKFFENLGKTAKLSGPALVATQAAAQAPEERSAAPRCRSRPTSRRCSTSLRDTGGLERHPRLHLPRRRRGQRL